MMAEITDDVKSKYVKQMFARLAGRYNLANRWMTWGQDAKWRREVIDRAQLTQGGRLLDVGTGTGDLALEAVRRDHALLVVGADFTLKMMQIGQMHPGADRIQWVSTDALELPYGSGIFDAVVSGYLLRNLNNVHRGLSEQWRVLKAGGRIVCLDTTPPPGDFWHLPVRLYLEFVIPILGGWVTGDKNAYRYLTESTQHFLSPCELGACMHEVGFKQVGFRRFMGGTMAIHWGIK
jgi:demethylmenaquinone methyltransferase/2-methoxy-6-polyprenyl-1,4-benzoquinol methylase